ncbi:RES domain-containing protein, partial [Myxococcota bacterium]|nr:RES domain-containing protein [Myxococcota bacterium]
MADLKVVRLTSLKYPQPDGEGAYRAGGRWNLKGTRVVYTSAQISLAVLEYLVHLGYPHMADDRVLVRVDIPGDVDIEVIGV